MSTKLETPLTVRIQPANYKFLHESGIKEKYGSIAAYINHLVSKARGIRKPVGGYWKPKGQTKVVVSE